MSERTAYRVSTWTIDPDAVNAHERWQNTIEATPGTSATVRRHDTHIGDPASQDTRNGDPSSTGPDVGDPARQDTRNGDPSSTSPDVGDRWILHSFAPVGSDAAAALDRECGTRLIEPGYEPGAQRRYLSYEAYDKHVTLGTV